MKRRLFQVLENFSDAPMTPKQILHVIQTKGLKEMRSGNTTLLLRHHLERHSHTLFCDSVCTWRVIPETYFGAF